MQGFSNFCILLLIQFLLGRTIALTTAQDDLLKEFPTYDKIYNLANVAVSAAEHGWNVVQTLTPAIQANTPILQDEIWPKILSKYSAANVEIKQMDLTIRFRRKPSIFLDALLGFNTFDSIEKLGRDPATEKYGNIKLKWVEMSSASTQMQRFYDRRTKDLIHGGRNMQEIVNSIYSYKASIWKTKPKTGGAFYSVPYKNIPEVAFKLLYVENGMDIFEGLKKLMDEKPDVLSKPIFDPNSCANGERHIILEPNGTDIPFYLLFYLCLIDIKYFMMVTFMQIYNRVFYRGVASNSTDLNFEMQSRIKKKVELFDKAFGEMLRLAGPSYGMQPGITNCDPPQGNYTYGWTYEKLTNFIKVFVSPEQALHKSGTCRATCDLLDATYSVCKQNETDCKLERERECMKNDRCESFDPVCPTGMYQCQNSSGVITACPSKRFDRLYEYIKGEDVDEGFHFGPKNETTCTTDVHEWKGGWRMEEDVLVDTPHFCEICVCYCFEPLAKYLGENSTRFFSKRLARSNWKNDEVIVGLKFHRIRDQIHIAYATAPSLSNHKVQQSEVVWNYPKYEEDPAYVERLNMDLRSLNLDDVAATEPDRVVTGVRFYRETYNGVVTYHYIGLEILTHQMDDTGNLIQGTGVYKRNSNATVSRTVYQHDEDWINGPDDPAKTKGITFPDSTSNMYVAFRGTSLEKDAAQSTIPYFDSQPLIANSPSKLKGIGIIHKSSPGYGGFLAFKLIPHDFGISHVK